MKTDELFYELFKVDPRSLFRLVQIDLEGEYSFESITAKTTEKRFDGLCKRIDGKGPNVFLEIQGYADPKIYWRILREVCTYYEQNDDSEPFVLIILFLDQKYDPGDFPLEYVKPPYQFLRGNVVDCLKSIWNNAGVLTVLKPLALTRKREVFEQIPQWKAELQALQLSEYRINTLFALLEYMIVQRFPSMNEKEVQTMLQLTPIENTVVGQQVFRRGKQEGLQEGLQEGQKKGLTRGELIGEIRRMQRILDHPVTTTASLAQKSLKLLRQMLRTLEIEEQEERQKRDLISGIQTAQRIWQYPVSSKKTLEEQSLEELSQLLYQLERDQQENGISDKAELIGEIRATQRFLKHPVSPKEELAEKRMENLRALLHDLQSELEK